MFRIQSFGGDSALPTFPDVAREGPKIAESVERSVERFPAAGASAADATAPTKKVTKARKGSISLNDDREPWRAAWRPTSAPTDG